MSSTPTKARVEGKDWKCDACGKRAWIELGFVPRNWSRCDIVKSDLGEPDGWGESQYDFCRECSVKATKFLLGLE